MAHACSRVPLGSGADGTTTDEELALTPSAPAPTHAEVLDAEMVQEVCGAAAAGNVETLVSVVAARLVRPRARPPLREGTRLIRPSAGPVGPAQPQTSR